MLPRPGISEKLLEALRRPSKPLIIASLAMLCLIWGSTWSVIQIGLRGIPPLAGVSFRFAIAGGLLLVLAFYLAVPLGRRRREWWLWLVNGTLAFSVSYGVVYWSEQWLPSGLTAIPSPMSPHSTGRTTPTTWSKARTMRRWTVSP